MEAKGSGWGRSPKRPGKKGRCRPASWKTPKRARPAGPSEGLPVPPPAPGSLAAPPPDQSRGPRGSGSAWGGCAPVRRPQPQPHGSLPPFPASQVGWPGESRWQVGLAVEDSPALGASQVGGLPDVVPEGTLLNMVLKRMHRPRSCSYQLLLEHQRPSRIQGLRWVSARRQPGAGPGARAAGRPGCCWGCRGCGWAGRWVQQPGRRVRGWLTQLHACGCAHVVLTSYIFPCWRGGRGRGFVIYLSPPCAVS